MTRPLTRRDPVMVGAGAGVAAAGWLTVGFTTLWYVAGGRADTPSWRAVQGVNAIGWAGAAVGTGLIVAGTDR